MRRLPRQLVVYGLSAAAVLVSILSGAWGVESARAPEEQTLGTGTRPSVAGEGMVYLDGDPVEKGKDAPAAADDKASDLEVQRILESPLKFRATFKDQPVTEALDFLVSVSGVNMVVDSRQLKDPPQKVSFETGDTLGKVAQQLAQQLDLRWAVVHRIIIFSDEKGLKEFQERLNQTAPDAAPVEDKEVYRQLAETRVSLMTEEHALKEFLAFLQSLSEVKMVLEGSKPETTKVTLKLRNASVSDVLGLVTVQTNLAYKIEKGQVVVFEKKEP